MVCSYCKADLIQKGDSKFCCKNCINSWNIDSDVPDFIDTDNYWSEQGFTRDVMYRTPPHLSNATYKNKHLKVSGICIYYLFCQK